MGSKELVKNVYMSESAGPNSRRPPGRWRDRVKENMCKRGTTRGARLNQARRERLDRERWGLHCHGYPFGKRSQKERGISAIDNTNVEGSNIFDSRKHCVAMGGAGCCWGCAGICKAFAAAAGS